VKTTKPHSALRSQGFFFAAMLIVILGLLFWKSFLPDYVHFNNDGPLGIQNTEWTRLPSGLFGMWNDLNSIGFSGGAFPPNLTMFIRWVLGPVGCSKFLAPIALFILGLGAWAFFRQLKLAPLAATLGALAAALTSTFFSDACWGVAPHQIAFGMDFLAMALIVSNSPTTPRFVRWTRLALAGFAVGINVMEAADIGAIFSIFIAAFVLFQSLWEEGTAVKKIGRGVGQIIIIAVFAAFIAAQTIISQISTNIQGVVGTGQDETTKAAHWDYATQWSLPKVETFGIIVPGLFGYRMNTPDGGNYWGGVGRDPAWDRYFANGEQGSPPQGALRFSGTGNYAGMLVILVAMWAIAQSLRRKNSAFSETHRRLIWFWTVILIVSLLFAFGRFAPFYAFLYKLPYFSTIRNPNKFLFVLSWALVIIFAYGIHGLSRRYLEIPAVGSTSLSVLLKTWWTKVRGFDRNWTSTCIVVLIGSLLAWLVYAMQKPNLVSYLKTMGSPNEDMAQKTAAFSVGQVGWFILFLALAVGLLTFIFSGAFAGRRAMWAGIFLGTLLVLDLGRADLPWIIHWNYKQKYDIDPANSANSTNPIINFLRDKPYEHRVANLPFGVPSQLELFNELYRIEWAQHHFPYYNIQSLDIIQMSRMPEDLAAYEGALALRNVPEMAYLLARRWQLTNTRYLLGPAGFLEPLNEQLDPIQHRFRIIQRFAIVLKPGIEEFHQRLEELTAVPNDKGDYALFDFTGALPRAKLYSNWQISTNDDATLQTLVSPNFDAWKTVLVSAPLPTTPLSSTTNQNQGSVEFKSYASKDIVFNTHADTPTVLLLNDKFDPNWSVFVDGKPAPLLRCNFIMRGVYLTPGAHIVEFQFKFSNGPLYVSLTAWIVLIFLGGYLFFSTRRRPSN
jgi:hypothetical protein